MIFSYLMYHSNKVLQLSLDFRVIIKLNIHADDCSVEKGLFGGIFEVITLQDQSHIEIINLFIHV